MCVYSNTNISTLTDGASSVNNEIENSSVTIGSFSTSVNNDGLVSGFFDFFNPVTWTGPSGWGSYIWVNNGLERTAVGFNKFQATAGATGSISGNTNGGHDLLMAVAIALQPFAATATPTPGPKQTATQTPTPSASPSPRPTPTPSPRPTSTPTPTATVIATATPGQTATPMPTATPIGAVFYVAPSGSDSNPGTVTLPWLTIQRAADMLTPGQTGIVAAGTYNEDITVSSSGTAVAPITLEAGAGLDVKVLNFQVTGSYWVLSGFDISNQTKGDGVGNGFGIYATGSASFDTFKNNYIHDLCQEGLYLGPNVSHISILNNRIYHAEMAGFQIDGLNDLVQGNEVWGTSQYPAANGGIFSVCSSRSGADADAMRFFGQNHVVKANYFHDITFGTAETPNPHTDCWQTWGSSVRTLSNVLFDSNLCRWPSQAHDNSGGTEEACEIEALDGAVTGITIQNNVFANMFQGLQIGSGIGSVSFLNNTFDHIQQEGIIYQDSRTSADKVVNNIFFDVGSGSDPFITSCNPTIETTDFFMRSGSPGSGCNFLSENPLFVSDGDTTGLGADYHLQASSPLIGVGTTDGVTVDFDGVTRGTPPSIGAYEK